MFTSRCNSTAEYLSLSLDICIYLLLGFTASSEICLSMHKHIQATACLHFIVVCFFSYFYFIAINILFSCLLWCSQVDFYLRGHLLLCVRLLFLSMLMTRTFAFPRRNNTKEHLRDLFAFTYCYAIPCVFFFIFSIPFVLSIVRMSFTVSPLMSTDFDSNAIVK